MDIILNNSNNDKREIMFIEKLLDVPLSPIL